MIVYIDVLIFVNILINYSLLSATKRFLHLKSNQIRIITAATFGALSSLIIFLPIYSDIIIYIIRLAVTTVICLISFGFINLSTFIRILSTTFILSVILSGILMLIYQVFTPNNMAIINDIVYFDVNPITLICASFLVYLLIIGIKQVFSQNLSNTIVYLSVIYNNDKFNCIAKVDTGCSAVEPFSSNPVIIVEKSVLTNAQCCNRLIPYKALGTSGLLKSFKADKVYINKKEIKKDIYIGVYEGDIDNQIKAIINSEIVR